MKTTDLPSILSCEPLYDGYAENEIRGGYTSDLLSDVMSRAREGSVLITIQAHKNTVAVASTMGLAAVVLCNDRPVPEDMIVAAREEDIPLFRTSKTQFESSGLLYFALRAETVER
jgi:hypothetical protein